MELQVKDIFELAEGLHDLSDKELPVGVAFKIQRISRIVQDEFKTAQDLRVKVINKYKEQELESGRVKLQDDKIEDFQKEMDDLMNQQVKLDIQKINLEDLSSISVTPRTLGQLDIILNPNAK